MRSFENPSGTTLAITRGPEEPGAQVIDLVKLPPGARPHPFAELAFDEVTRARLLDCGSYDACLTFAAEVKWAGFHCRRCPQYEAAALGPRAFLGRAAAKDMLLRKSLRTLEEAPPACAAAAAEEPEAQHAAVIPIR